MLLISWIKASTRLAAALHSRFSQGYSTGARYMHLSKDDLPRKNTKTEVTSSGSAGLFTENSRHLKWPNPRKKAKQVPKCRYNAFYTSSKTLDTISEDNKSEDDSTGGSFGPFTILYRYLRKRNFYFTASDFFCCKIFHTNSQSTLYRISCYDNLRLWTIPHTHVDIQVRS